SSASQIARRPRAPRAKLWMVSIGEAGLAELSLLRCSLARSGWLENADVGCRMRSAVAANRARWWVTAPGLAVVRAPVVRTPNPPYEAIGSGVWVKPAEDRNAEAAEHEKYLEADLGP